MNTRAMIAAFGSVLVAVFAAFAYQYYVGSDVMSGNEKAQLQGQISELENELQLLREELGPIMLAALDNNRDSFIGPAGPEGVPGPPGPQGPMGESGTDGDPAALPSGIVAASTLACTKLAGRWSEMTEARGRFIVGWNPKLYEELDGTRISVRDVGDVGGKEQVLLTEREMPNHKHSFSGTKVGTGGWGGQATRPVAVGGNQLSGSYTPQGEISDAGGGAPHPNMPPYIALYFCKKD